MIAWGITRLTLLVLVPLADLNEAHVWSQLTVSFAAVSVLYLVAGAVLWRRVRVVRG